MNTLHPAVVLVHGYADRAVDPYEIDLSNSIQIKAARELVRRGFTRTLVFNSGVTQKGAPPLAETLAHYFKSEYAECDASIIIDPDPRTSSTRNEIKNFRHLAEQSGWEDCYCLGKKTHLPRIQRGVERLFPDAGILCAEDILLAENSPSRGAMIDIVSGSEYALVNGAFSETERLIHMIDRIPLIGGLVLDMINRLPGIKGRQIKLAGAKSS